MQYKPLKEYTDEYTIANRIRMQRTQYSGSFLVVEGEKDQKTYSNFINEKECNIEIAFKKDALLKVLEILHKDNFAGILAIADADYWHVEKNIPTMKDLFITDSHDLETIILQSPALEKVLKEFGSKEKIATLHGKINIRSKLIECGINIGYLRLFSLRKNLNLKFEGLKFSNFIDKTNLNCDLNTLIKELKNNSRQHILNENILKNAIQELKSEKHDPWQICCGHDLCAILSLAFRKFLGSKTITIEFIECSLRLAYEGQFFTQTKLYASIKHWEKNHSLTVLSL